MLLHVGKSHPWSHQGLQQLAACCLAFLCQPFDCCLQHLVRSACLPRAATLLQACEDGCSNLCTREMSSSFLALTLISIHPDCDLSPDAALAACSNCLLTTRVPVQNATVPSDAAAYRSTAEKRFPGLQYATSVCLPTTS